jgi:hypothetical protein
MAPKKKQPGASSGRAKPRVPSLKKYTPEEAAERFRSLPPVDRGAFDDVIRRLVTKPPPKSQ